MSVQFNDELAELEDGYGEVARCELDNVFLEKEGFEADVPRLGRLAVLSRRSSTSMQSIKSLLFEIKFAYVCQILTSMGVPRTPVNKLPTGNPSTVRSKQYITVARLVRSSVSHLAILDANTMHSSNFALCESCRLMQSTMPV